MFDDLFWIVDCIISVCLFWCPVSAGNHGYWSGRVSRSKNALRSRLRFFYLKFICWEALRMVSQIKKKILMIAFLLEELKKINTITVSWWLSKKRPGTPLFLRIQNDEDCYITGPGMALLLRIQKTMMIVTVTWWLQERPWVGVIRKYARCPNLMADGANENQIGKAGEWWWGWWCWWGALWWWWKLDQVYCAWLIKWVVKREIIQ